MQEIKGLILAAVVFGTTSGAAVAGPVLDEVEASRRLIVATNTDYAPQSSLNANNELEGFDVDVAAEIARRMGAEVEFVTPGWEIMTAGKWANRWQMAVGSITPTTQRAEVLDFPAIYYFTPAAVGVHAEASYADVTDLNGKHFGVVAGSTYEDYLRQQLVIDAVGAPPFEFLITPGEITAYSEINELEELALGDGVRIDAVIQGMPALLGAIDAGMPIKVIGEPVFYEPLAIATDKGDAEFNDRIATIVAEMKADGTLKALSEKWYGTDYTSTSE
jgi:polar amino acid transport system substrate-binding protein